MKNIRIRSNSTGRTVTLANVSRLQTQSAGGFPVNWIEDDESSRLADVDITLNGKVTAFSLGVYGIRRVHVAVDFSQPVTIGNITCRLYVDTTGRPHISVSRSVT